MLAPMVAEEPCPICGCGSLRLERTRGPDATYRLLHCNQCSLEHWQPLTAPDASYYEREAQSMYIAMHEGHRKAEGDPRFSRFLDDFGGCSEKSLLDVGCADGALMDAFRARGNRVTGIDVDTTSLRAARARGLDVHRATLRDVHASLGADRRFDFVTMFDVLEHLTTPRQALEAARDLLSPGGLLVGTVPNRERLFANLVDADFPPHHFLRFSKESLTNALQLTGLSTERVEVFQWGYAGTVLLSSALRTAKRLRQSQRTAPASRTDPAATVASQVGRRLRRRVARVVNTTAAQSLRPVEQTLGRGFKLYFVARLPT